MTGNGDRMRDMVAAVATAYFSKSHVNPTDIRSVIDEIASGLRAVGASSAVGEVDPQQVELSAEPPPPRRKRTILPYKPTPEQIQASVSQDALISFEDGHPYRTLRRHLSTRGMTPDQYRAKWGLPSDYPMVAPAYSEVRSQMAKSLGLGRKPAHSRGRGRVHRQAAEASF